jgi:hypothetical protein
MATTTITTNPPQRVDIAYESVVSLSLTNAELGALREAGEKLLAIMRRKRHTIFLARWDSDAGKFKFYEAAPI